MTLEISSPLNPNNDEKGLLRVRSRFLTSLVIFVRSRVQIGLPFEKGGLQTEKSWLQLGKASIGAFHTMVLVFKRFHQKLPRIWCIQIMLQSQEMQKRNTAANIDIGQEAKKNFTSKRIKAYSTYFHDQLQKCDRECNGKWR